MRRKVMATVLLGQQELAQSMAQDHLRRAADGRYLVAHCVRESKCSIPRFVAFAHVQNALVGAIR